MILLVMAMGGIGDYGGEGWVMMPMVSVLMVVVVMVTGTVMVMAIEIN